MKTLLLRLEGPMQSWGISSRFTERDTGLEPSKSGVIGIICAAMGKPRCECQEKSSEFPPLNRLARIRMGVRIDAPGIMGVDFQTAGGGRLGSRSYGVAKADGGKPESVMSWRYFLQDACFLVGLQDEDAELLTRIHMALRNPVWPLSLGRKSYVPSQPIYLLDGIRDGTIEEAFKKYEPLIDSDGDIELMQVIEHQDKADECETRIDVPLSFDKRQFGIRYVNVSHVYPEKGSEG